MSQTEGFRKAAKMWKSVTKSRELTTGHQEGEQEFEGLKLTYKAISYKFIKKIPK